MSDFKCKEWSQRLTTRAQNHFFNFSTLMHCAKLCDQWKETWPNVLQKDSWAQNVDSALCFACHWQEEATKNGIILMAMFTLCLHHKDTKLIQIIQKLLSPLRSKPPSRCMKSILIIINSHLNLIVRLSISLFKMSQNYDSDFSFLLNSS